ncbi:hypothetical protein [Sinorhizobium fredii]|uniref:hypothetical protein n=1 Tax=Rhizobium fredii TaxID=380 RepID=UPI0012FD46FC|nr:hypothetical protein [Sinorhizobium fredii]
MTTYTDTGLLQGYLDRPSLAKELRCSERTIIRYENLPDGLPSLMLGGRKLYRVEAVRQWIASQERRPNPTRRAGR